MKLENKLDTLQALAQAYEDDPHKTYLIALLAEHAEEEEMDTAFLEWVEGVLGG